ncbi:lipopolysaccharide transport periplasmic protein LptA [Vibrio rumoiensis]|uniref:Lipopolysaccharide export system protein LptA n=1 Tax=Vibrio rumoiensis 1S-45 TaxID=1188252 RepID=A0A1E5E527_9VIBR|nr:lipopolysaccharide transport periplasmic protein LptA [Vibrio rumoiensis]OEF28447.1 lipopolysaccharide transport periplasmic protein LptA [Vibrio rumoiensis 1S-45]
MKLSHLSLFLCLLAPSASWALTSDREQPIYIDSDQQNIDMKSNKVTFTGNVTLKQGSIHITADTLIVFRDAKTGELTELQGYGEPSHFSQKTDDGKTLKGQANTLVYKVKDDKLVMTTNAELHQDDSVIRGKVITYHISSQNLKADGGGKSGERVSTVIQPSQLEQK